MSNNKNKKQSFKSPSWGSVRVQMTKDQMACRDYYMQLTSKALQSEINIKLLPFVDEATSIIELSLKLAGIGDEIIKQAYLYGITVGLTAELISVKQKNYDKGFHHGYCCGVKRLYESGMKKFKRIPLPKKD